MWFMLAALIGCGPQREDTADRSPTDTGWTGAPVSDFNEPTWTGEQAAVAVQDALTLGFPDTWAMAETLATFMAAGDPFCPGDTNWMSDVTITGCDAVTGWWYVGIGGYEVGGGEDEDGPLQIAYVMGDMQSMGPDGEDLHIGGEWTHILHFTEDEVTWTYNLTGSWSATPSERPWLEAGVSGWLTAEGAHPATSSDEASLRLDGSLSIGQVALYFDDLSFSPDVCGTAPVGALRVRDPGGGWFTKTYTDDCDPCGPMMFHGEQVSDSVCLDLEPLFRSASGAVER